MRNTSRRTPSLALGAGAAAAFALAVLTVCADAARSQEGPPCCLEGSGGLLLVRSAQLRTRGVLSVSLGGHYYDSADLAGALGTDTGRYATLHVAASYGLTTWLELSLDAPFRWARWDAPTGALRATGLSNPRFAGKVGFTAPSNRFHLALEGGVGLPLARAMRVDAGTAGSVHLTGGEPPDGDIMLLMSADLTQWAPLRLHANIGWGFHRNEAGGHRFYPDSYPPALGSGGDGGNDALLLRAAAEFPGRRVDLFTEFRGDILRDSNLVAAKENPLTLTPGLRIRFPGGWQATAGFTVAISADDACTPDFDPHISYPDWEATLAVSIAWPLFAADSDGDGIPDIRDRCVRVPEDLDGFEDADGCPDEDNDNDGIPDYLDQAPLLAEDLDGFEDTDGVPDLDNDGDGIVDERDMCPDEAEDLDGFEDEDGCPDN